MPSDPLPVPARVHWTKEVQRRSYVMEAARERGATQEELARLQAEVDEADANRQAS